MALAGGHQGAQTASALRRPQLAQRLGLDLPDPLARDIELLPDLFQRVLALAPYAESHPDDLLLLRRECLQNPGGLVADIRLDHGVYRRPEIGRAHV